jgi:signal transduction histidine kinase
MILVCQLFALLWVIGDLWASHAQTMPEKQIALTLLFTGSLPLPALWWETTRRYVLWHGLGRSWLNSRWTHIPILFAVVAWLFMLANPWHGQLLEPVIRGRNDYRWGLAIAANGNYLIAFSTFALCVWATLRHTAPRVRFKLGILGAATLLPVITNVLHVYLADSPREDIVALGLGVGSLTVIYGINRRHLFDLLPVALHEIVRRDPDGLLLLDRGGRLLLWNPAAEKLLESMLLEPDMPVLSVLAERLEDARTGQRLESSEDLNRIVTEQHDASLRPVFRYTGGGGESWLRLSVMPIPSRRGRLAAVCLRVENVANHGAGTHGSRDPAYGGENDERLAMLAAGISHDVNNLLGVIEGRARLALEDAQRGLPVRRHLVAISRSADVARDLNAQLVSYAELAGAERHPLDLSRLVDAILPVLREPVPPRIELRMDLSPVLPEVDGNPAQLREVAMNLVNNAVEAIGDDHGVVSLCTGTARLDAETLRHDDLAGRLEPGEYVELSVSDTGPGLDATARKRVFEAFYSTRGRGRGLGLAVVFAIVDAHGGAIAVESRPGNGSVFRVLLPLARPHPGSTLA